MGPTRALIYVDPMEMNVLPDRIIQQFEWGWGTRILWTDGRQPLMDPDLPAGGAIRRAAGTATHSWSQRPAWTRERGWISTAIRTARTWCLRSDTSAPAYDVLELTMTINDPKIYTRPGPAS